MKGNTLKRKISYSSGGREEKAKKKHKGEEARQQTSHSRKDGCRKTSMTAYTCKVFHFAINRPLVTINRPLVTTSYSLILKKSSTSEQG